MLRHLDIPHERLALFNFERRKNFGMCLDSLLMGCEDNLVKLTFIVTTLPQHIQALPEKSELEGQRRSA